MFGFIKDKLSKIYTSFTSKLAGIFNKATLDADSLKELESLLISADMGVKSTKHIINKLNTDFQAGKISKGEDLKNALEDLLIEQLHGKNLDTKDYNVFILVGINGSGKTTFASKLANLYAGKRILFVAGDTFRAAAVEQLNEWAKRLNVDIEVGKENQDPASVIFAGCERFKRENYDILIIDTAGRLQTKVNLMKELEKVKKVIVKQLPESKICTLLTVDSMLGQNSLEQAKLFNESTNLDGIVLTKMDGTGKAGIAFAIVQELNIPIAFICYGEEVEKIKKFDAKEYVQQLLSE
ncbi:MAG: signal recognition particle-docking protein FtsY [Candidatus Babeliales bacterium]|nr:signal recognition particle-docking protein FtsY [Candidatus Babeliales bacterium]